MVWNPPKQFGIRRSRVGLRAYQPVSPNVLCTNNGTNEHSEPQNAWEYHFDFSRHGLFMDKQVPSEGSIGWFVLLTSVPVPQVTLTTPNLKTLLENPEVCIWTIYRFENLAPPEDTNLEMMMNVSKIWSERMQSSRGSLGDLTRYD